MGQATAAAAIQSFISARYVSEYGYLAMVNPDALPDSVLHAREDSAQAAMLEALAVLPDDDVERVIGANLDTELDGSHFPVTTMAEIERWRSGVHHLQVE